MSSLCKAGLFGETLGDLEPVYDLFTIMGESPRTCQKEQNQKEEKHGRGRMKNP